MSTNLNSVAAAMEESVDVAFSPEARQQCWHYEEKAGRKLQTLIEEILAQDPRPASERSKKTGIWHVALG